MPKIDFSDVEKRIQEMHNQVEEARRVLHGGEIYRPNYTSTHIDKIIIEVNKPQRTRCDYCGQYGDSRSACDFCGAPIR